MGIYSSDIDWLNFDGTTWTDDVDEWTDLGSGANQASTANESYQGETCLKLYSGTASGGYAQRSQVMDNSGGTRLVSEIRTRFPSLGTRGQDQFQANLVLITAGDDVRCRIAFGSDKLEIYDGTGWTNVGDHVKHNGNEAWQIWIFDVNGSDPANATVDVYLDDAKIGTGVDCSETGDFSAANSTAIILGTAATQRTAYIDYWKMGNDLIFEPPIPQTSQLINSGGMIGRTYV